MTKLIKSIMQYTDMCPKPTTTATNATFTITHFTTTTIYDYNPSANDDGEFVYLKIEIAQTSPKIHFNNNDAKEI